MPKSTVMKKEVALKLIKENWDMHIQIHEESMKMFKENYTFRLNEMLEGVKKDIFDLRIDLILPKSYANHYERAYKMIEHDCREEIILEEQEYSCCILNQWSWFSNFSSSYYSNSVYNKKVHGLSLADEEDKYRKYLGDKDILLQ